MQKTTFMCAILLAFSYSSVLLTNGNFEQDLTVGWTAVSSWAYDSINRGATYESDPDYEVLVLKDSIYCGGMTKLDQTVDIPTTDLTFSVKAMFHAYENMADELLWAGAAVDINYLDAAGTVLGKTRINRMTDHCPWTSSSTLHLINAVNENWNTYSFNISAELANLPGVSPTQVKKISVVCFDSTNHSC
ncbi:MAG TPA: hypothetical protein VF399_09015 [bacterium]